MNRLVLVARRSPGRAAVVRGPVALRRTREAMSAAMEIPTRRSRASRAIRKSPTAAQGYAGKPPSTQTA